MTTSYFSRSSKVSPSCLSIAWRVPVFSSSFKLLRTVKRAQPGRWCQPFLRQAAQEAAHYRGTIARMAIAQSKVTAQGQISVPSEIRRRLGIGPGSILEWEQEGGRIIVRRAARYSSEDLHRALFEKTPEAKTLAELKEGVRKFVKNRSS